MSRVSVVGALLGTACWAPHARAQPAANASVGRTAVEIYLSGELAEGDRAELMRLIATQLAPAALELRVASAPAATSSDWLAASAGRDVLMRVILDVTRPTSWRLEIGDVARGRRLVRELPGEGNNAAAAEAVANVVTAAALALREGFELGGNVSSPAAAAAAKAPAPSRDAPPAQPPAPLRVVSDLALELSSLSAQKSAQLGAAAALGVRLRERFGARVGAAQYFPAHVASALGDFRLDRRALSLSLSAVLLRSKPLELELDLGGGAELFERVAAAPALGVAGTDDSRRARFGAVGALRARYRFISVLAVEVRLGGAYYPTPLRYVARPSSQGPLLEAWPWVLQAALGFELSAP